MSKIWKKLLAVALTASISAGAAVAGTVAYLQDTDEDVNVMTLGSVHIKQHEYQRKVDETTGEFVSSTDYGYVLEGFKQGKPLYPATEVDANGQPYNYGAGDYGATRVKMSQVGSHGSMDVFVNSNAQDKFVTVENTGKSDAYVRTIIAYETGSVTNFNDVVMTSSFMTDQGVWEVTDIGIVKIDDNNYYLSEYLYNGAKALGGVHENGVLPAGDTTYPSLAQVYMKATATNEDVEAIDGNKNGTYDILVFSQAVQTEGFADAETALDTAFGDITTTNHPWIDGADIPVVVDTADELVAALEAGEDVVLDDNVKIDPAGMSNAYGTTGINVKNGQTIDGNGNTLDIAGAGGTWDSGICTSGGLIKDLTVTGSFRGIFIKKDTAHNERVILENVIVDGPTYTISCDSGTGEGLTATDCTFKGWTSFAATLGDAEFINCTFGAGAGYNFSRPYAPTTYVNCAFEAGHRMDPRAAVTFENCTLDGVALTADNIAELVYINADKATIK